MEASEAAFCGEGSGALGTRDAFDCAFGRDCLFAADPFGAMLATVQTPMWLAHHAAERTAEMLVCGLAGVNKRAATKGEPSSAHRAPDPVTEKKAM